MWPGHGVNFPLLPSSSSSPTPPHLGQISPLAEPEAPQIDPPVAPQLQTQLICATPCAADLGNIPMATSKKEPLYPSRKRTTRMTPSLRPSSSESSYGYGMRRARSVPSSPDRKFGPSAPAPAPTPAPSAAFASPELSLAGRSTSFRSMSSSGSSIHGSKPSPDAASKPMLARTKSEKATATSQRPPTLAVLLSNSFKDMAKTTAASKSPSTLLKSKQSPRPCADKGVASPKPTTSRVPSPGAVRGGKTLPVSWARASGATAKKTAEVPNGGASASSRSRGAQRAVEPSTTRKEKEEEPSMQFEESESLSTPSIEDHLHQQLPDPVDLKPIGMAASGSARHDQQEPYAEQQGKNEEEIKEQSDKEDAGGSELHNGGQGADASRKNKPDIVKAADELERVEKEEAKTKSLTLMNRTPSWRKDDPRSNDVIEEAKSKLLEERKSRVKALVGAFETVMSFKE